MIFKGTNLSKSCKGKGNEEIKRTGRPFCRINRQIDIMAERRLTEVE
jgi:hypothetical protein